MSEILNRPDPLFLVAVVILAAAYNAGGLIGARTRQSEFEISSTVQGVILALLRLLLRFTFAMALSRYETRRNMVLDEFNAIGTAFLRASLAPVPHRSDIQPILAQPIHRVLRRSRVDGLPDRAACGVLAGHKA